MLLLTLHVKDKARLGRRKHEKSKIVFQKFILCRAAKPNAHFKTSHVKFSKDLENV
jgi:hypothetical protein